MAFFKIDQFNISEDNLDALWKAEVRGNNTISCFAPVINLDTAEPDRDYLAVGIKHRF